MRTTKLNKSQIWSKVNDALELTITANTNLKKDKDTALIAELVEALKFLAPQAGNHSSNKINSVGDVWCNYYEQYFAPEAFQTKLTKPNAEGERKEVFKANSINADKILRHIKNLKTKVTKAATDAMRAKQIDTTEWAAILDKMDSVSDLSYEDVTHIPTMADIVGLTDRMVDDK